MAFFAPLLAWTNLHTGCVPWVLLSLLQAGYLGAARARPRAWVSPLVDRLALGVAAGDRRCCGSAQEALRDRTPFGGFPWGRLAFSQGDSPLLRLAALGGAPLVTFAVARRPAGCWSPRPWRPWRPSAPAALRGGWAAAAGRAVALVGRPSAAGAAGRRAGGRRRRRCTVAIVQGNVPRLGLDFNAQRRAVLDNHVDATIDARRPGRRRRRRRSPTWWSGRRTPATSTRCSTPTRPRAISRGRRRDRRADPGRRGAARPRRAARSATSASSGSPGTGPTWTRCTSSGTRCRSPSTCRCARIARMVSNKVDLVRSDFVAGTAPGRAAASGPATVGDVICFEVAYDEVVRDTVTGGAQLLVVQTNNATFNEAEAAPAAGDGAAAGGRARPRRR